MSTKPDPQVEELRAEAQTIAFDDNLDLTDTQAIKLRDNIQALISAAHRQGRTEATDEACDELDRLPVGRGLTLSPIDVVAIQEKLKNTINKGKG